MDEPNIFWFSVLFFTIFSAAGSAFIMLAIWLGWRKDYSSRTVFKLSLADFCLSVICLGLCAHNFHVGHLDTSSIACKVQPVITWYFMEVSILILMMMALYNYKMIFSWNSKPPSLRQEIAVDAFCWGTPIITTLFPLLPNVGGDYGNRNNLWCSFSPNHRDAQVIHILLYYIPSLIVILSCYGLVSYRIKNIGMKAANAGKEQHKKIMKATWKLFLFVLSYFIVWTPLVICYIYEASADRFVSFPVEYVTANMLHMQGIFNFILYGFTHDLKSKIKDSFLRLLGRSTSSLSKLSKDNKISSPNGSKETIEMTSLSTINSDSSKTTSKEELPDIPTLRSSPPAINLVGTIA